jgi:predicted permease
MKTPRFYQYLLQLLPRHLRRNYGEEMEQVFAARLEESPDARSWLWINETASMATAGFRARIWDNLKLDLRAAWRAYGKNPAFAVLAFLMLSVGIGGAAAMYSMVNTWVFDPLPYPDPDKLTFLSSVDLKRGPPSMMTEMLVSPGDLADWRHDTSFDAMSAWSSAQFNLTGTGGSQLGQASLPAAFSPDSTSSGQSTAFDAPERLQGARVNANFFGLLGVTPVLGRDFLPEDDQPGAPRCVILTYEYWQGRFMGDPSLVGKTIGLDDEPAIVRGILPQHFQLPLLGPTRVFTPLALSVRDRADRTKRSLQVLARRRDGVSFAQARESLTGLGRSLSAHYPDNDGNVGVYVNTLAGEIGNHQGNEVDLAFFGLTIFVLLIVCSNIASLMLAKSVERQKEVAVRYALGATRARVIRQLLTEHSLIFLAGAAGSIAVAKFITEWISNNIPYESRAYLRNFAYIPLDSRGIIFAFLVALACGLIFGLAPALESSKTDLQGVLKEGAGRGSPSRRGRLLRDGLVGGEIALATVLLVCSALLLQSLKSIFAVNPGFQPQGLLSVNVGLPPKAYQDLDRATRTLETIGERVRSLAGVQHASIVEHVPYGNSASSLSFWIEGQADPLPGEVPHSRISGLSPGYFATMQIPVLAGRDFSDADDQHAPRVAVINDVFAERYWPHQNPLGRHIHLGTRDAAPAEVVGVVKAVKMFGLSDPPELQMYVPLRQRPVRQAYVVVRAAGLDAGAAIRLGSSVREALWSVDRNIPVPEMKGLPQAIEITYTSNRMATELLSWFTLLALVLAATGLYAMMAWSVTQRSREIGIRMALGAASMDILSTVLRRGVLVTAVGAALGLGGATLITQSLAIILPNVNPRDPATFAAVSGMLAVVALTACYLPARRASQMDPASALRHD